MMLEIQLLWLLCPAALQAYKQAAAAAEDANTCLGMVLEALTGDRDPPAGAAAAAPAGGAGGLLRRAGGRGGGGGAV